MKKYLLSLMLFAAVSSLALYVVSCQKEHNPTSETAINTTQPSTETSGADERNPRIQLVSTTSLCDCSQRTCSTISAPSTGNQFNGIRTMVTDFTHNLFNINGNGLRYTIYQGINTNGPIVASFICNSKIMNYVNPVLLNNTAYCVKISYPGDVDVEGYVTTSNCRSLPCGIGDTQ
jgi:hypothetical protein